MNKLIENFVLLERISASDFSEVFKSKHKLTNEFFAIKVISFEKFATNPKYQEQLSNELRALKLLDNFAHIVKFIKLLKTKNNVYLVYEFCEGGTLQNYEEKNKIINEKEVFELFTQLLEGVSIIHSNKIVHGDLKPSNLLFKGRELKIIDFGFCKFTSNEHKISDLSKYFMGSPIYMAPEMFENNSEASEKTDIYAIGVIVYEMLFGMAPFEEKRLEDLIDRLKNHYILSFPRDINNISIEMENILKKMLEKDPAHRCTASELQELLKKPKNERKEILEKDVNGNLKSYFNEKKLTINEEIPSLDLIKNMEQLKTHKNVELAKTTIYSEMREAFYKKINQSKKIIVIQVNFLKSIIELNLDESNVYLTLLILKRIRINYIELILSLEKKLAQKFSELMNIPLESIDNNLFEQIRNDERIQSFVSNLMIEEKQCEETLQQFKNTLKYCFELADYNNLILQELNQDIYEEIYLKRSIKAYFKIVDEIANDLFMNCKNESLLKEILIHGILGFDVFEENANSEIYDEKIKEYISMNIVNLHNLFEKKMEESMRENN